MLNSKRKVLFLCNGNSCRSQMAEAIVNARLSNRWQAFSAGSRPKGFIHPMATQVLEERGIHHRGTSKGLDAVKDIPFDLVITVCGSETEDCPVWFGSGIQIRHTFRDPSLATGTEEEKLAVFRKLRDEMIVELPYLLDKNDVGKMES
jgi:arsenate reductase (thioredoxin)